MSMGDKKVFYRMRARKDEELAAPSVVVYAATIVQATEIAKTLMETLDDLFECEHGPSETDVTREWESVEYEDEFPK